MSVISQIGAVTAMNIRNIPTRLGTSLVVVIGIAGVVGVLVALLSMAAGFKATLASTGKPDRVIVLRGGANDELQSVLSRDQAQTLLDLPGIKKDAEGKPLAALELYLLSDIRKKGNNAPANVVVRSTSPEVLKLRPEIKIIQGRMFQPGLREVVVGRAAQGEFAGLTVGSQVEVRDGPWTVVGVFESGGDVHESELMVDVSAIQSATQRQGYTSAMLQLESPEAFQAFKDRATSDPRLSVSVQSEPEYYASRSKALSGFITTLGYTVATIMGIGALFGALNTMYAAVSTRSVEIATLRAIGFGGFAVVVSVLIEALVLALAGGTLGAGIAYVVFNGYTVSTLNFQTFSQVAFDFKVTPALLQSGITWACVIGLLGGLFPAIRAARLPVVDALRAS